MSEGKNLKLEYGKPYGAGGQPTDKYYTYNCGHCGSTERAEINDVSAYRGSRCGKCNDWNKLKSHSH